MCHIYFVSTAMDSWSGFRVHTVIFQHASVPLNSQPVFVSRSDAVSHTRSLCLSASFYVFVPAQGKTDRKPSKTKAESNTHDTERKRKRTRGTERERRNEEKAYYQQTDGPPIHSGPAGTWRDNSLHLRVTSAAERGGALKHDSVCVRFCLLTCKQKANL